MALSHKATTNTYLTFSNCAIVFLLPQATAIKDFYFTTTEHYHKAPLGWVSKSNWIQEQVNSYDKSSDINTQGTEGRKFVSPARAALFAKALGRSEV